MRNIIYIEGDDFNAYNERGMYQTLSPERLSIEIRRGVRRYDERLRKLWEEGKLGGDEAPNPTEVTENLKREIRQTLRDYLLHELPDVKMNAYPDLLNVRNGIL